MDTSFIGALQKADPTFRVMPDQKQTAINASGFEVDVKKMSDFDDDLWAVQISDGNRMLGAGRFSQVIVAETGHMAVMHTLNPRIFVTLKTKLSQSAGREKTGDRPRFLL